MDDWVSASREVEVAGARGKGRKMTWKYLVYILNERYSGICGGTS